MRVLITGATGLIGQEIGKLLVKGGHELIVLTRNQRQARLNLPFPCTLVEGDLGKGPVSSLGTLAIEAVIHLAGENVGEGRWSKKRKTEMKSSRVLASNNLFASLPWKSVRVFVAASAIGIYGETGDLPATEESPVGRGFLAELTQDWEEQVRRQERSTSAVNCRFVSFRIGIVLATQGGALKKMLFPFLAGVAGKLGSGNQWMSWVHLHDVAAAFAWALETPSLQGTFNLVAPSPVRNQEFTVQLCHRLGKKPFLPVPQLALKLLLGEMSVLALGSTRVSCQMLLQSGFRFRFPSLGDALKDLCEVFSKGDNLYQVEQYLPIPPKEVFPFFSEARNLEQITPPNLNFHILSQSTPQIQQGTLIDYRLRIHGVPVSWRTLIESWAPPRMFVDTQLKGPYSKWHHTHEFEALGPGTLIRDRVLYRLPLGKIGWLTAGWWVDRDVRKIFTFRKKAVAEIFKSEI